MKRLGLIGGLMVLLLAACTSHSETRHGTSLPYASSPELAAIDSLMWRQPDSALTCLLTCFDTCSATEYNRHYANLLFAELLYKNDYEQTNHPALLQAVHYFDSLCLCNGVASNVATIAFLDARAHYINGVGHYENDSAVPACKEYIKALEVMEEHFEEKELVGHKARFMALTYTRLTDIFSDYYIHESAIYFAQCSLPYYKNQILSSWNLSWVLNEIGSHYDMMNELDSAEYYYQRAATAMRTTNTIMYRDIAAHQAYLKYKKDSLQADATLLQLENLLSRSESTMEHMARCASIGEVYYREKKFDSAWHYLNMVYCKTTSIGIKKQTAEWLVEICKTQDRASEMHEYAEFLVPFASKEENNSGIKSQLTKIYNAFLQTRTDRQHQMETKKHAKQVIAIIGSLLFILLMIIILNVQNKRHKRKLETQIETERHSHKMQQAALAARLRQSNAALKAQSKTAAPIAPLSYKQEQNEAESYAEEPVCQQILAVCNDRSNPIKSTVPVSAYASIALTDAQKAQLKEAAIRHYGLLFEKLKLQYPELKEKDFMYCYLCLLGLDNMQIAVMLQHSLSTIWDREKRLKKVLGSEDRVAVTLHSLMAN